MEYILDISNEVDQFLYENNLHYNDVTISLSGDSQIIIETED